MSLVASPGPNTTIDDLPSELLERIFGFLTLESKLSAGLTCRSWLNILKPVFAHLTDIILIFEDDYCHLSSSIRIQHDNDCQQRGDGSSPKKSRPNFAMDDDFGSGLLTVNLCACPKHLPGHGHWLAIILWAAGSHIKKLIIEDYLLQKECFVDGEILTTFVRKCQKLCAIELHHVDLKRICEKDLLETCRSGQLTELFFNQCSWSSWTETVVNRTLRAIIIRSLHLRQIHITACPFLNDRTLQLMAKTCLSLWYVDFSACKAITARGLAHFFYYMQRRQSDLLYIKIHKTWIDGNELQYLLYRGRMWDLAESSTANPLFIDDSQWSVCNFVMETGHRACSFQNRYIPGKSVIVFM